MMFEYMALPSMSPMTLLSLSRKWSHKYRSICLKYQTKRVPVPSEKISNLLSTSLRVASISYSLQNFLK